MTKNTADNMGQVPWIVYREEIQKAVSRGYSLACEDIEKLLMADGATVSVVFHKVRNFKKNYCEIKSKKIK